MTGKNRQTLHAALEAERAPVRLSEARRAAILAAAGGAGVRRRGGRPWLVWAFDLEGTPVLPRIEPPKGDILRGQTEKA